MALLLANNAVSRLAVSLAANATNISVSAGDGAKFPSLPPGNDWFPLTLVRSDGTFEIVRATVRSGDTINVQRAQEGTAAMTFSAGDRVELRLTAAALNTLFGGTNSTPAFGGLELTGSTPFVDFHFGFSTADYTSRIWATAVNEVQFLSASNGRQLSVNDTGIDVVGFGQFTRNLIAKGGIIELGDVASSACIQIRNDASLAYKSAGGAYGAFGSIWTSVNFNPASRVVADSITTAGFAGDNTGLPYFRRASDSGVYYLQPALGFNPVRTLGANTVLVGWNGSRLVAQVDSTPMGALVTAGSLAGDLSNSGVGSIGSYALLALGGGGPSGPGELISGAACRYSATGWIGPVAPTGTWRIMGAAREADGTGTESITLCLRVS